MKLKYEQQQLLSLHAQILTSYATFAFITKTWRSVGGLPLSQVIKLQQQN